MIDKVTDSAMDAVDGATYGAKNVRGSENHAPGLADRLRRALSGKNRMAVLAASGVSKRTLARALSGQPIRGGNLAALATAMDVSIDWLAHARGPMLYPRVGSTMEDGSLVVQGATIGLFGTVNMDRLAEAIAAADTLFSMQNKNPTPHDRARVETLLYDMMTREAERKQSSSSDTSLNPGDGSGIG